MFDFYFYITAIPAVILFGISKGGFAGPISILAVPLMSMAISPVIAAGIMLPILIVMDISSLYFYWNKWKIEIVKLIIPPSIVGILIGSLTFSYISESDMWIDNEISNNVKSSEEEPSDNTPSPMLSDNSFNFVYNCTLGGALPFIFTDDKDSNAPDRYAICTFRENTFN